MIKLKPLLMGEAKKLLVANNDTEAFEKYKSMYKRSFPVVDGKKWNLSNDAGIKTWYAGVKKWFTDNFGVDDKTWKQLFIAYTLGRTSDKIKFQGETYDIQTGMDIWEYTFDVLVYFGYITYKSKIDPKAEREKLKQQMLARLDAD